MADILLQTQDLQKSFGGVMAADHVSLKVKTGEYHAVIGPNGAGKTTLISQLSGMLRPDAGTIWFAGRNITQLAAHRRSQLGLARSFQVTSVFKALSVLDNVALAVQAHQGHSFRFWRPARADRSLCESAMEMLEIVGLQDRAAHLASAMSHGECRQLEIAMALASNPRLMLLDEPMAGMGPKESASLLGMLKSLENMTIVFVEHDMNAVFAMADRISVMVYGRLIATGTPDEIRSNEDVRCAYLGEAA